MEAEILNLKMHETWAHPMKWGIRFDITRVIGGFVYRYINRAFQKEDIDMGFVFVPDSGKNEKDENLQKAIDFISSIVDFLPYQKRFEADEFINT